MEVPGEQEPCFSGHHVHEHLGTWPVTGQALPDLCGTKTVREEYQFISKVEEKKQEGLDNGVRDCEDDLKELQQDYSILLAADPCTWEAARRGLESPQGRSAKKRGLKLSHFQDICDS